MHNRVFERPLGVSGWRATLEAAGALLIAAVASSLPVAAPAHALQLAPHRAVYEITLERTSASAGISTLKGRMVYELKGSLCDGYRQTMRFVTETTNPEGVSSVTDMRSTFKEDGAGKDFEFDTSQYRDEELAETTVGRAEHKTGDAVHIELRKPERQTLDIERAALFPIQHSVALIEAARSGKRVFTADLYDGSEKGAKVFLTTAIIGAELAPGYNTRLPAVASAKSLDALKAWPVSLSYFNDASKGDGVPSYELAFIIFENGVSRRLVIDYGSFAIRGTLSDLEMLETPPCKSSTSPK